jgi:hypothetical protein
LRTVQAPDPAVAAIEKWARKPIMITAVRRNRLRRARPAI